MYFDNFVFQLNEEIDYFAYEMMKATFPLFAKIDVMGENAPSSWKYLTGMFSLFIIKKIIS